MTPLQHEITLSYYELCLMNSFFFLRTAGSSIANKANKPVRFTEHCTTRVICVTLWQIFRFQLLPNLGTNPQHTSHFMGCFLYKGNWNITFTWNWLEFSVHLWRDEVSDNKKWTTGDVNSYSSFLSFLKKIYFMS